MARKLRVEYPGAIYHVMNRGDRREPIFKDDADRQPFLETLGEACGKTGWQVHAYCLMGNHFHLVVVLFPCPHCHHPREKREGRIMNEERRDRMKRDFRQDCQPEGLGVCCAHEDDVGPRT